MVSIKDENIFHLRQYYLSTIIDSALSDPFKNAFISRLGLREMPLGICASQSFESLPLYERCAIDGVSDSGQIVSKLDLSRLLGQASIIDSTPRPWVSDFFGVMAVKWCIRKKGDEQELIDQFEKWVHEFIPQQVAGGHANDFEKDIARYLLNQDLTLSITATVPLFFHYSNIYKINDHKARQNHIRNFMTEFKGQLYHEASILLIAIFVFVFDKINLDISVVPPDGWSQQNLIGFLENIEIGLRRWTWESNPRTVGSNPVKWSVQNEYHVQNILYLLLAPIFVDIADEVYLPQLGQKTPRIDLYLPSMHAIIEVKYRKDSKKSFQALIGEIGEDASLYRSSEAYEDSKIICVLWDNTCSTQEHAKFKEGVMKIRGIDACVVINSPSTMLG